MSTPEWWATTRIRTKSVRHVETARLQARLTWLGTDFKHTVEHDPLSKKRLREVSVEAVRIIAQLQARDADWSWPYNLADPYRTAIKSLRAVMQAERGVGEGEDPSKPGEPR